MKNFKHETTVKGSNLVTISLMGDYKVHQFFLTNAFGCWRLEIAESIKDKRYFEASLACSNAGYFRIELDNGPFKGFKVSDREVMRSLYNQILSMVTVRGCEKPPVDEGFNVTRLTGPLAAYDVYL